MGAGIAGIASNADDDSIMVYHDRSNYGEWEFIYDPLKKRIPPDPITGQIKTATSLLGQQPGNLGQQPANPNAAPATNPNPSASPQPNPANPFGTMPGFPPAFGGGRKQ